MSSILDCRVHLSEHKPEPSRISIGEERFRSLFDASLEGGREKMEETNAEVEETRGEIGLFLPRFGRTMYYRRSHVGAQTTDYRVSSSESPDRNGGKRAWE